MKKPHIIIVDDQLDVLSSLRQDLKPFQEKFTIDDCESAKEAEEMMEEHEAAGIKISLILSDHIMPEKNGIDFLTELKHDERFEKIRKVLITGQASHSDTINAINEASIDYYISKPWTIEGLHNVVKTMITHWILDHDLDYRDYEGLIDTQLLFKEMKNPIG